MSASPQPAKPPEFPPTPFLSPRNVPLWFSVLLVAAVSALVWWTH